MADRIRLRRPVAVHDLALDSGPRVRGAHGEFPEDFGGGAVQQPDDVAAVLGAQFAEERIGSLK